MYCTSLLEKANIFACKKSNRCLSLVRNPLMQCCFHASETVFRRAGVAQNHLDTQIISEDYNCYKEGTIRGSTDLCHKRSPMNVSQKIQPCFPTTSPAVVPLHLRTIGGSAAPYQVTIAEQRLKCYSASGMVRLVSISVLHFYRYQNHSVRYPHPRTSPLMPCYDYYQTIVVVINTPSLDEGGRREDRIQEEEPVTKYIMA